MGKWMPCILTAVGLAAAATAPVWTILVSGVTGRLRGISVVSEKVVWASGANGTIVRTADGGLHWKPLSVPEAGSLDFRDIDAIDERTAYALSIGPGEASRIYKTNDAGEHWTLQFQNRDPKVFLDAMAFWNGQRGLAVGDSVDGRFVILHTVNGGVTWERAAENGLPPALSEEGAFAASGTNIAVQGTRHAWIGLGSGRVLRTEDGGKNWQVFVTGIPSSPSAGIFSIAFQDTRRGVAVGGDYKQEDRAEKNAAVTEDGGRSWRIVRDLGGYRSVVRWAGGTTFVAVGPSGADISYDSGKTWRAASGPGFHTFDAAPGKRLGFGAGERGLVGRLEW